jgi:large subunit ribosomal protein L4
MELAVKTLDAGAAGQVTLDDAVFGIAEIRPDILQRMVRYQLSRRQAGTHKAQSRAEVDRTSKKMYRQKGTGGARHGARNAPIFVGGGVAHGPRPRSHAIDLPKKVRRLALAHALSSKVRAQSLIVIDDMRMDAPKTKALVAKFEKLGIENALIIGGAEVDANFALAARNIPNIDVLPVQGLNVYDILRRKTLVLTRDAIAGVHARFADHAGQAETAHDSSDVFGKGEFVDDIQLIDGIGPKAAKDLAKAGVATLSAFVALSDGERDALLERLKLVGKVDGADMLAQAKAMIGGEAPRAQVDRELAARLLSQRAKQGK